MNGKDINDEKKDIIMKHRSTLFAYFTQVKLNLYIIYQISIWL